MVQENCLKPKIIIITGPTAVGKSDLAVKIAKMLNTEIISADSMQIYKGLDIGTGKITEEEKDGVVHHMLDIVEPYDEYSVSDYVEQTKVIISKLNLQNKIPIVVGGTGFYLNGLINGYNFSTSAKNDEVREKWNNLYNEKGADFIYESLKSIDPISAEKINRNDVKRLIRAIEIYETTGKPKSEVALASEESEYDVLMLVITKDREELYKKINARVDKMFSLGLVDEVKSFIQYENCQSMQAIGYKEVVKYLKNETSLDEAIEEVKKNSRNYAKRQMTFFRWIKHNNKHFIDASEINKITSIIENFASK
ncbi:MAG: tRNA (adenosine(37)-N6)-dimethylallyltransferase MiaA [Clostridiales bacterium]|nr:tRNA (adenosine(37)-N6)-dimethylallyltransferase MiaA [Clostridiales bacterium]